MEKQVKPTRKTSKPKAIEMETVQSSTDWIVPLITMDGEKHELVRLVEEDAAPIMHATGFAKISNQKNHSWVSYMLTFQGNKIIKCEVSEPDMRAIAEEAAKIYFQEQMGDL